MHTTPSLHQQSARCDHLYLPFYFIIETSRGVDEEVVRALRRVVEWLADIHLVSLVVITTVYYIRRRTMPLPNKFIIPWLFECDMNGNS